MTNPNNAVGTNAAYGGRTSVNAFNDDLSAYSRGVLSGWACAPSSGLTVALGGNGTTRDVAVAEDVTGNKTSINNISGAPIEVTIDAAPASNSRIDVIVAYVDSTLQGSATVTDNYGVCGLITVSGTASTSPTAPSESAIRSAITADGAAGATAYYVVLAKITIASGTTDLTTSNISAGDEAKITSDKVDFATYTTGEQVVGKWINGKTIYRKCYTGTINITANTRVNVDLEPNSGIEDIISVGGCMGYSTGTQKGRNSIPSAEGNTQGVMTNFNLVYLVAESNTLRLTRFSSTDRGAQPYAVWVEYTKQ